MKYCIKCDLFKTFAMFYKNKGKKEGLQPFCKICSAAGLREWRRNNTKKVQLQNRRNYLNRPAARKEFERLRYWGKRVDLYNLNLELKALKKEIKNAK